jgi:hypothetical protein
MFGERKNEPRPAATMTLGAARAKLIANGYGEPVSLLTPDADLPPYMVSEHPAALRTRGPNPLAALILSSPDDTALDQRVRSILERRGLQRGPCRVGSDQRELWPLQCEGDLREWTVLDGAVQLICTVALGAGQGTLSAVIPLDGAWLKGDLCSVPYAKLPPLSAGDSDALRGELEALKTPEPYEVPRMRRSEPTAADVDLAELHRNPEALRKRLFELTGNPAMQEATLRAVRELRREIDDLPLMR